MKIYGTVLMAIKIYAVLYWQVKFQSLKSFSSKMKDECLTLQVEF